MTHGELLFLTLVLATFSAFAAMLAGLSSEYGRRHPRGLRLAAHDRDGISATADALSQV